MRKIYAFCVKIYAFYGRNLCKFNNFQDIIIL